MRKKVKHIFNLKNLGLNLSRLIPRQHHLNGTIFHRVIGDRLFDPRLWKPTQKSVSAGLAIGIFIALTPTIGVQIPLIILSALFLRVNIPVALAASWVTNPLTAPVIYSLQYKLGLWLSGAPDANELAGFTGMLRLFFRYAMPLWVGSLLSATFCSSLGYVGIFSVWGLVDKLRGKKDKSS
ncbi:MAG: DUF2062 domain-containing protein [Candidatus Brocadiaceae bacterium]|nr:DUF2062 domain-containing protein [Candidatus Brocadiaceae bacterium]